MGQYSGWNKICVEECKGGRTVRWSRLCQRPSSWDFMAGLQSECSPRLRSNSRVKGYAGPPHKLRQERAWPSSTYRNMGPTLVYTKHSKMKNETIIFSSEKLRRLYDFAPTDAESLGRWYEEAGELVTFLRNSPLVADQIPIRIWQFLSDADIRMKDKDFAVSQNRIVRVFLEGLAEGTILSGQEIDERMDAESRRVG